MLAAVAVGAFGCVDPISLEIEGEDDRLVVQADVVQGDGPHTVLLSLSADFERGLDALQRPVTGARVTVTPEGEGPVLFPEQSPGFYRPAPGALTGTVGQTYRLRLELADGRVFESTPQTMQTPVPIERAYTELRTDSVATGRTVVAIPRITLLAEADDPEGEANFYRWVWRGQFEALVCSNGFCTDVIETCYFDRTGRSLIELAEDRLVDGGTLTDQLVATFTYPEDAFPFVRAYALEVEQQVLTPEAFTFWQQVRDTRDRTGGLFDPPPDVILGNVRNVADERDYALGTFTVTASTRKGTCARLGDFPDRPPAQGLRGFLVGRCQALGGSLTPGPLFTSSCGG